MNRSEVCIRNRNSRECARICVFFQVAFPFPLHLPPPSPPFCNTQQAFLKCTSLCKVQLPSVLTSIGMGCFGGCVSLVSLDLPAALPVLAESTFVSLATRFLDVPGAALEGGNTVAHGDEAARGRARALVPRPTAVDYAARKIAKAFSLPIAKAMQLQMRVIGGAGRALQERSACKAALAYR